MHMKMIYSILHFQSFHHVINNNITVSCTKFNIQELSQVGSVRLSTQYSEFR